MDPLQQVDLTAPTVPEPVDVSSPPTAALALAPEDVGERAFKASVGLPGFKSYDELYKSISEGQDKDLRLLAANHASNAKEDIRQQFISQLSLARMGGPVPKEQLAALDSIMAAKIDTDPNSVFEEHFAGHVMDKLKETGMTQNWWRSVDPKKAEVPLREGSDYTQRYELVRTLAQNARGAVENQSWIGWGFDQAKGFVPFYPKFKLSGNVEGGPNTFFSEDFLTGSNLEAQAAHLWALPSFDQFKQQLFSTYERLKADNPGMAEHWVNAMLGQSQSEKFIENIWSAGDYAIAPGIVKGLSSIRGAVKSSVVSHVNTAKPTPITIAEGAGDIEGAGMTKLAKSVKEDLTGTGSPISNAMEALPSVMVAPIDAFGKTRGSFSREFHQQLLSRWEQAKEAVINAFTRGIQVDRLNGVDALGQSLEPIRAGLKAEGLPGMENRVVDVTLQHDDITGGLHSTYFLGDEAGLPFSSEARAKAFAEQSQLGQVVPIQGPGLPRKPSPPIAPVAPGPQPPVKVVVAPPPPVPLPNFGFTVRNKAAGLFSYDNGFVNVRKVKAGEADAGKFYAEITPKKGTPTKTGIFDTREQALEAAGKDLGLGAPKVPKTAQIAPTASVEATAAIPNKPTPLPSLPSLPTVAPKAPGIKDFGFTAKNRLSGLFTAKEGGVKVSKIKEGEEGAGKFTAQITPTKGTPTKLGPFDTKEAALEASGKHLKIGESEAAIKKADVLVGWAKEVLNQQNRGALNFWKDVPGYGQARALEKWAKQTLALDRAGQLRNWAQQMLRSDPDAKKADALVKWLQDTLEVANQPAKPPPVIQQHGAGFYVTFTQPVDETKDFIRAARLTTNDTKTPESWLNAVGGKLGNLRTADETLSMAQRENRKAATTGVAVLHQVVEDTIKEIQQLKGFALPFTEKRAKWKNWQDIVRQAQVKDPSTGATRAFYNDLQELTNAYMNSTVRRAPDEQEASAYFAYRRAEELGAIWNKFVYNKFLESQGGQKFTLKILDPRRMDKAGAIPFLEDREFHGKPINRIPQNGETVLFLGSRPGELGARLGSEHYRSSITIKGKLETQIAEDLASGKRTLIELSEPETHPLGDHYVKYAVVESRHIKRGPIDWDFSNVKVKRLADYDFDHYLKQAKVEYDPISKLQNYLGDTTIAAFNIRGIAKDIGDHLNHIRVLLKERKFTEAEAFHASSKIPLEWPKIAEWFQGGVTPRGVPIKPRLSLDEPITITNKHNMVIEHDKELSNRSGLKDRAREGYSRLNANGDYDRFDQFSIENKGTRDNPLYNVVPVQEIDPIASLNRSLSKTINSNFLDDYKVFSIEHWLAEAKKFLDISEADLKSAPEYHFYNPKWLAGAAKGEDFKTVQNLQTAHYQIRQFLGVQNVMDTFLHSGAQHLVDATYEKSARLALAPRSILPFVRDPFTFVRTMTFDLVQGLFAIPQLVVQLNGWNNIAGIAGPQFAASGAKAMLLHAWSRINKNPEILARLDALASTKLIPGTIGFKPGQFTEANMLFKNSGFERVSVEHVLRNSLHRNVVSTEVDRWFLNPGRSFFRWGEEGNRAAAYYTSYLEFRQKNPLGRIGNKEQLQILERADILSTNMTRASASALNSGALSIPMQFVTYTLRLAEQFTGKRLTTVEKARLFGWNAAVFGVPSAFGLTGLPFSDILKQDAIKNGYVTGMGSPDSMNKYLDHAVMEGLPSLLTQLITGNTYNIGERFGPGQGLEPIRELMRGDKTALDLIGGAAYSKIRSTIANLDGFNAMLMSGLKQDGKFTPKIEDVLDIFKEISLVNAGLKLNAAIKSGQVISKRELYLADTSKGSALFMFLSGLQPQSVSDMYNVHMNMQKEKELEKLSIDNFKKEFSRGINAMKDNNPGQSSDFMKRAFYWLNFPDVADHKKNEYLREAIQGNESLVQSINWDYYKPSNVPARRTATAQKVLPTALQSIDAQRIRH